MHEEWNDNRKKTIINKFYNLITLIYLLLEYNFFV